MPENRRSGTLYLLIDGVQYDPQGNFTYNLGSPKRDPKVGPNRVQGYKEMPQVPRIEGEITDARDLDVKALQALENGTATLELANGKNFVLRNCWYAAEGDIGTEEGNIQLLLHGLEGEEI